MYVYSAKPEKASTGTKFTNKPIAHCHHNGTCLID